MLAIRLLMLRRLVDEFSREASYVRRSHRGSGENWPGPGENWLDRGVVNGRAVEAVDSPARQGRVVTAASRLLILEIVSGTGNAPAFATRLDLMILVSTRCREHALTEYRRLVNRAGLALTQVIPTCGPLAILETMPVVCAASDLTPSRAC